MERIALQAQLDACRTTKDGGWIVQFACGQDQVKEIGIISELRDENLFVVVMTEAEFYAQQQRRNSDG